MFTVGDLRSFLESIRRKKAKATLAETLKELTADKFQGDVGTWYRSYITLTKREAKVSEEMDLLTEYEADRLASRIQ
jgi:hypothetical protein